MKKTQLKAKDGSLWVIDLYVAQAADTKWFAKIEIKVNGKINETYYSNPHKTERDAILDGEKACKALREELKKDNIEAIH